MHLKAGADPNVRNEHDEPALVLAACTGGNVEAVRELLHFGARVDETDADGNTALIACARDMDLAVVKELVEHGANVNARNADGDTPLTNAASWGGMRVVKYLCSHSADSTLADGLGVSAAELARQQGHAEIGEFLERTFP